MSEIQFEIAATDDGGVDIGLLENHRDATKVALSKMIHSATSQYLQFVKQHVPGCQRSLIVIRETVEGWKVTVDFDQV